LVEDSSLNEEFSAQRGLINEMFPYIYEASKRMSSRAISRWLDANKVKLSAATIAKALRNPEPYWQEVLDEIEPAAWTVARAHKISPETFLEDEDVFSALEHRTPYIEGVTDKGSRTAFDEYEAAAGKLREDWFSMPSQAIEACLTYADFAASEGQDEGKDAKPQAANEPAGS
jgi:hypothetical protein